MADITVTPDALAAEAALHTPLLPGAAHTEHVTTLAAAAILYAPDIVISFPVISRKPSHAFSDEPSDKAVLIGDTASGYPVLNKLFTFDPRTFSFELPCVPEADKLVIMAFYEAHKDKSFPWYNDQDYTWYEVVFAGKPTCRLDGRGDLWRITLSLRQAAP